MWPLALRHMWQSYLLITLCLWQRECWSDSNSFSFHPDVLNTWDQKGASFGYPFGTLSSVTTWSSMESVAEFDPQTAHCYTEIHFSPSAMESGWQLCPTNLPFYSSVLTYLLGENVPSALGGFVGPASDHCLWCYPVLVDGPVSWIPHYSLPLELVKNSPGPRKLTFGQISWGISSIVPISQNLSHLKNKLSHVHLNLPHLGSEPSQMEPLCFSLQIWLYSRKISHGT
jgi:hypothetical protein